VSLFISGCGPGQLFGPTITPTFTPTPVPTITITPTLTPTLIPTLTPTPTATPISGIESPIDINGTLVKIVEVNIGKYMGTRVTNNKNDLGNLGGYEAKEGFRFAQVVIEITQGESEEKVSEWTVTLQDMQGKSNDVVQRFWGTWNARPDNVAWTFIVPENANQLTLVFPGGAFIDLSPLISK
jgi:hypothetical protein